MTKISAFATIASGVLAAALLATPALAANHDRAAAVQSLETEVRFSPDDSGAVIELAAAYQRAGRSADANTALRRVLTLDNRMLETPTGDAVWSHDVARRALTRDSALASR